MYDSKLGPVKYALGRTCLGKRKWLQPAQGSRVGIRGAWRRFIETGLLGGAVILRVSGDTHVYTVRVKLTACGDQRAVLGS